MKHTQGEWKYNVSKKNEIQTILPNGKILHLGFIYSDDCGLPTCCRVEEHANAKLIAAAPKMLEALMKLMDGPDMHPEDKFNLIYDTIQLTK